ncbi:MAG: cell division topological specificity factor MinE [Chromatiales bacterium]|nr:cell division topological specificity factor MinE [Chromatiales bacterium]
MGLLSLFRSQRPPSAQRAKERLQVIVAHERSSRGRPSYLPQLQQEILEVIRRYVDVSPEDVQINVESDDGCEVLALNVTLPERPHAA